MHREAVWYPSQSQSRAALTLLLVKAAKRLGAFGQDRRLEQTRLPLPGAAGTTGQASTSAVHHRCQAVGCRSKSNRIWNPSQDIVDGNMSVR